MLTCKKCGRELHGIEFDGFAPKGWCCAECNDDPGGALYCRRGDAVKYSYPKNGTAAARALANKYLVPGNTYYVDEIKITPFSSYIKVQGLQYWFNSALLERVPHEKKAP